MGKKFLTILVFALFGTTLSAKTMKQQKVAADTVTFMVGMAEFVNKHKGEKLSVLIDKIRECGMPIRKIGGCGTSPWTDPEGKCYIDRILVSCYNMFELFLAKRPVPVIDITLEPPYMDADLYDQQFGFLDWNKVTEENLADMLKDLFVMSSAEFYVMPRTSGK